jgi:hypothetical protein
VPADGWRLADKGGYPVQAETMKPILEGLLALRATEPKTERPKLYDRLEVGDPAGKASTSKLLEFTDAKGAVIARLIVGKRRYGLTTDEDGVYVRKPDEARAWLARPGLDLPGDALAWIDRKVLDLEADSIKELDFSGPGVKPLVLARDKAADKLQVKDLPKDAKLKSDNPGSELMGALRYLDLQDVRPAAQVIAAAGATVHVASFDGMALDLSLVDQDGASWLKVTATGTGDGAKPAEEVARRTAGWAYKIPDARAKTLKSRLADLLAPPAAKGS